MPMCKPSIAIVHYGPKLESSTGVVFNSAEGLYAVYNRLAAPFSGEYQLGEIATLASRPEPNCRRWESELAKFNPRGGGMLAL